MFIWALIPLTHDDYIMAGNITSYMTSEVEKRNRAIQSVDDGGDVVAKAVLYRKCRIMVDSHEGSEEVVL